MRAILLISLCAVHYFSYGQNSGKTNDTELPTEIQKYYKNLSLINSLSTTAEKSSFMKYLEDDKINKAPSSEREFFVLSLLKDVMGKELKTNSGMRNSFGNSKQVTSRIIYEISKWDKSNEFIAVSVKTLQISVADNYEMIEYFENEKPKNDDEIISLSTPSFLTTEVHKWVQIDKNWYKQEVRVVLTY